MESTNRAPSLNVVAFISFALFNLQVFIRFRGRWFCILIWDGISIAFIRYFVGVSIINITIREIYAAVEGSVVLGRYPSCRNDLPGNILK